MRLVMLLSILAVAGAGARTARAAEVKVLGAGATTSALEQVIEDFRRRTGHTAMLAHANGPDIQRRIGAGEQGFDVIAAPEGVLRALAETGRLPGTPTPLGRVGIAAAAMRGQPAPDLSTPETLKAALLAAKTVVISRGSAGTYLEGLFQRLGVADALAPKLVRVPNGADVVERLLAGSGPELGFSAATELVAGKHRGLVVAGLIPASVQNVTAYAAVASPGAAARPEVAAFMALLAGPEGRAAMAANGLE